MKFISISYPLMLLMDILVLLNFINWHGQSLQDYNQRQLDLQVNYSCDAAAQMMLQRSSSISNDYNTWGSIWVDPQVAYDAYEECMLRNLGWGRSEENRVTFKETYVPFFCVVTYDGYYMYQRAVNNNDYVITEWVELDDERPETEGSSHKFLPFGNSFVEMKEVLAVDENGDTYKVEDIRTYDLTWTPKLPFTYETVDGYYAFNLSYDWCYKVDSAISKVDLRNKDFSNRPELQKLTVSNCITSACTDALRIAQMNATSPTIYIPPETEETNSISGPSVITYVDPNYGKIINGNTVFAVGGSKIDKSSYVICYKLPDGSKLYTFSYNKERVINEYKDKGINVNISKMYTSPKLAAQNGYYFDMSIVE